MIPCKIKYRNVLLVFNLGGPHIRDWGYCSPRLWFELWLRVVEVSEVGFGRDFQK